MVSELQKKEVVVSSKERSTPHLSLPHRSSSKGSDSGSHSNSKDQSVCHLPKLVALVARREHAMHISRRSCRNCPHAPQPPKDRLHEPRGRDRLAQSTPQCHTLWPIGRTIATFMYWETFFLTSCEFVFFYVDWERTFYQRFHICARGFPLRC